MEFVKFCNAEIGIIIIIIITYYYYYYYVSPLCRIFTIMYLQQVMFLRYTVLHLLYNYSLCCFPCYCYVSTFRSMCAVSSTAIF